MGCFIREASSDLAGQLSRRSREWAAGNVTI